MLVMRFGGSSYEIRRGKIADAIRNAAGRPPVRLAGGKDVA
jgi:hypothetical protein